MTTPEFYVYPGVAVNARFPETHNAVIGGLIRTNIIVGTSDYAFLVTIKNVSEFLEVFTVERSCQGMVSMDFS